MTILFVCSGNTCRSPLAVAAWRALDLADGEIDGTTASSAGLAAWQGGVATAHAQKIARAWKTDLSAHRARALTPKLARNSNLIVTMTREQAKVVRAEFGLPSHRVRALGEFESAPRANRVLETEDSERENAENAPRSDEERLAALLNENAENADYARAIRDIDDPFGASLEAYESCAARIKNAVAELRRALRNDEIAL